MMNDENISPDTQPETEAAKRQFENVSEAFKAGGNDGAAKAREQAPNVKSTFSEVVHDLAYGLAFGTVFTGAFANEFIPKTLRDGLAKGAKAGKEAGKKARERAVDAVTPSSDAGHSQLDGAVVINS